MVSDAGGTITINVTSGAVPLPTTGTFPIAIGRERMQVTGVSGTAPTYTLTLDTTPPGRTKGGTIAGGPYAPGALVMSTPLPIIPVGYNAINPYAPPASPALYGEGTQAQMCVQEYGLGNGGIDANGFPQVYDFATFIDIGDGYGKAGP